MMLALVMMMMVVVVEVVCLCLSQPLTSPLPATLRAPLAGFQLFVMMLRMLITMMLVVKVVCLCLSQPLTSPLPATLRAPLAVFSTLCLDGENVDNDDAGCKSSLSLSFSAPHKPPSPQP